MIIGHGDIASVLSDKEGECYFASGVSNSSETDEKQYQREKDLLLAQDKRHHIVYFSSLSIFYQNERYQQHKREMEGIIKLNFPRYCITRIGNITWGDNPHTLINTLRAQVDQQAPIQIKDVYRYVVEKDEFLYWVNLIPDWNCEMNIPGTRMKVREIVKKYVL